MVKKARRRSDNAQVAIKCISRDQLGDEEVLALQREVEILSEFRGHPHIVGLLELYDEESTLFLVTEYIAVINLFRMTFW